MSATSADFALRPISFEALEGWKDDDPSSLFVSMRECRRYLRDVKPYRSGSLGLTADDLMPLLDAAESFDPGSALAARDFFEEHCLPFAIEPISGESGFVTGFYEPEVRVSASKSEAYPYPFYRRPADLIDLDEANRPADMDPSYAFGRVRDGVIMPYPDRQEIDQGCLEGMGLEIAWARSKSDIFFTHVQGAARLLYEDGRRTRITFAAKAGHPFSAIGKLLIERGEIARAAISMQSIRSWLEAHPEEADAVFWHNRSYIFFSEYPERDPAAGPIAAAKLPLRAGRSLAVDRHIHTFGFPFFVQAESLRHLDAGRSFQRLMLAHDTGSAILGPARGDIFTGSGFSAGEAAGTIRHAARFVLLIPRAAAARYR